MLPQHLFIATMRSQQACFVTHAPLCRAIVRRSLQALAYCHGRGIAHGALGPSSLLLNTYEDRKSSQLSIKLDNFGFARQAGGGPCCPGL